MWHQVPPTYVQLHTKLVCSEGWVTGCVKLDKKFRFDNPPQAEKRKFLSYFHTTWCPPFRSPLYLYKYLEELEVLEYEGLVGHGDLLVEADLDAGHDGHGGAEPAEEEDDDERPHPPLHQEGRVEVLEHLVEES